MLVFLEIIIRIFFPQNLNYTMFDSILMYRHIPNFEVKYARQEFSNEIKFNSKGLRDYEYSYEKPGNTYRILLLGSSFSQGLQVALNSTYENILEKKLNSKNGKYEIVNTAVGGWGAAQELLFLRTEGLKYKPDLILLDFSMRDITENAINKLITVKDGKLIENIPVRASLPKKVLLFCSRYSHLCSLTQTVILNRASKNTGIAAETGLEKINLYYKENSLQLDEAFDKTFPLIKEMKKVADENKIPMIMFIIPSKEQVDNAKLKEFLQESGADENEIEYDKMQKLVIRFANQNNLSVLDMLPYFRQKNVNNTFYYNIDGHWNAKGHQLAADVLHNYLISRGIVS